MQGAYRSQIILARAISIEVPEQWHEIKPKKKHEANGKHASVSRRFLLNLKSEPRPSESGRAVLRIIESPERREVQTLPKASPASLLMTHFV